MIFLQPQAMRKSISCAAAGAPKGAAQRQISIPSCLVNDINRIIPGYGFECFCNSGVCLQSVIINSMAEKGIDAFFGKLQLLGTKVWFYDFFRTGIVFQNRQLVFLDHPDFLNSFREAMKIKSIRTLFHRESGPGTNDMVAQAGLEPARHRCRGILSPLRLPVPSLGRAFILCQEGCLGKVSSLMNKVLALI